MFPPVETRRQKSRQDLLLFPASSASICFDPAPDVERLSSRFTRRYTSCNRHHTHSRKHPRRLSVVASRAMTSRTVPRERGQTVSRPLPGTIELPSQTRKLLASRPWDSRLRCVVQRMAKRKPHDVFLKIYDITEGRASKWLQPILGVRIEGIWHTGVYCFDQEHFYCDGIQSMSPHLVELKFSMTLRDILYLGKTDLDKHDFQRFLRHRQTQFSPEKYDLIQWNCNHFSDLALHYLFPRPTIRRGSRMQGIIYQPQGRIPDFIARQPKEFMSTVRGRLLIWMTKHVLEKVDNFLNENFASGLDQIIARWTGGYK